ncbi:ATP-binding cassette subfamily B protein [Thermosporothrix hazakensis]|uniref:ATP-binding cassette subfamily B protein n=1 Tax=Thermosporothrix hazakensis TaxID=644383 RepID=A0A326UAX3_THEHA|nr:ABC transporter ATP-binding protein [Thermosporothrix hazakensis]PZW34406.1 ATP-binding cassette subfamily B protein [Thermosporothrix hazakensis]GCE46044.1 multidrug ABC transporter ATP-binding protein [Thermosporothrix hazakensis]
MISLFRFLKPYRVFLTLVLVLVFLQTLSDLYLPTLMADIVDTGIVKGDTAYILTIGSFMLLVALGGTICSIGVSFFSAKVAVGFGKLLRHKLFTHVESFSLHEFDTVGTASLITRTTNDTNQVQQVLVIILRMMISAPIMCIGGIIMALSQDVQLSWVLVAIIPLLVITILLIMGQAMPLFTIMQKKIDRLNLVLDEGLTGIRVIRAFNRLKHERQRFHDANLDLTNTAIKANRIVAASMPVMMLIMNISTIAIIWFGSIRINNGDMQVGALMAFLQYAMQILFSLLMFSMLFIMLPRASASAARINEILKMRPEITDTTEAQPVETEQGIVEFRDVTFSYPGAEEPALSHISFKAEPGKVTAIIGGTGSGKSTLVNLIPRFYDIDSGTILIDGVDIRTMSLESLRAKCGFVPQKAVLFSGSVAENIRYGKEDATDEEIRYAAEIAQAAEFISEMKDGYDTMIAQGGVNVSGGQKQRLSIARALVRKPDIYVFDDSFSALDFKTDAKLRAALKDEIANATVFIVAQRVSTIMDADQILVLDQGRIAGMGTHHELMQSSQVYREIVASQLSLEEIK